VAELFQGLTVGEIAFSGPLLIALPLAVLAGIVAFASPCVLPLAPAYLGYVAGATGESGDRAVAIRPASRGSSVDRRFSICPGV